LGVNVLHNTHVIKLGGARISDPSLSALFFKGVVANAVNPKVALFFFSFLPQFAIPANGRVGWQMATLGLTFTVQAALLFGLLGYFPAQSGAGLPQATSRRHA
jgi:threonine/homoserine/homoserine lactone efflux protein